jgi:hypothetical protein
VLLTENDADDEVAVRRRLVDIIKFQQSLGSLIRRIRRHDIREGTPISSDLRPRGLGKYGKVVQMENKNRSCRWREDTDIAPSIFFMDGGWSRDEGREEVADYTAGETLYGP